MDCLNGDDLTTEEFATRFEKQKGGKRRTFFNLLKEAEKSDRVHKCSIDQKWAKVQRAD